jgi:hypothetical protein
VDSILTSIKKLLGIEEEYTHFDGDIIICINSILAVLTQVGIGPSSGYSIADSTDTWADFLGGTYNFEAVKSYVHLRVRLLFDPPTSSALLESMNKMVAEFEWRLHVNSDPVLVITEEVTEEDEVV